MIDYVLCFNKVTYKLRSVLYWNRSI